MNLVKPSGTSFYLLLTFAFLVHQYVHAHNGKIAHAFPLGKITVDGNFSDWPQDAIKYSIGTVLSDSKPTNDSDFSGFFQIGYRLDNSSLYIAFTITDNDFIEDTSENVRFNTQDCLELSIDARHLPFGSGVVSFMYSKKLRNTNHAFFDPFSKAATWEIMEVAHKQTGNVRYYEWRIRLDTQLVVGKSVGFDFQVFDKDPDGSFTINGWGKGGYKFRIPGSLGDVILLPENQKMATVEGNVSWDKKLNAQLPGTIRFTSVQNPRLWFTTEVDSSGNYVSEIPAGKYQVMLPDPYFSSGDKLYTAIQKEPIVITARSGNKTTVEKLVISGTPVPDLIPEKAFFMIIIPHQENILINLLKHIKSILAFLAFLWH